jgi:hypothetical protein
MKFFKKVFPALILSLTVVGVAFAASSNKNVTANYKGSQAPGKAVAAAKGTYGYGVYIRVVNASGTEVFILNPINQNVDPNSTGYITSPVDIQNNYVTLALGTPNNVIYNNSSVCPFGFIYVTNAGANLVSC